MNPPKSPGRPKGAANKITKALKEMILGALDEAGGQSYLVEQSSANPTAFMTLVGKVLPLTVAGDKENPLELRVNLLDALKAISAKHDPD